MSANSNGDILKYSDGKNEIWDIDLDYSGENNFASFFSSNSNIHSYPAKAVPNMVYSLLTKLQEHYGVKSVLDPFVGSGTVALESKVLGMDFYGSDLNPLAILLTRTKALTINNTAYVDKQLRQFVTLLSKSSIASCPFTLVNFDQINYWFKKKNIEELSFIKRFIVNFLKGRTSTYKEIFALILLTAFSSTIRTVSLTRNSEFKLYRMSPADIEKFNLNAIEVFNQKVISLLDMLESAKSYKQETITEIHLANAKDLSYMGNRKVDLVLTSPPYGDSRTTVAYGEFSKLSLQWMSNLLNSYLGISVYADNCDEFLLGGKNSDPKLSVDIISKSKTLQGLISEMTNVIEEELIDLRRMQNNLEEFTERISNNHFLNIDKVVDEKLLRLIKERIRLEFYRKINNLALNKTNKQIKAMAKRETQKFLIQLKDSRMSQRHRIGKQLIEKLPAVKETIRRKIKAQPKRMQVVISFFKDLYKVVEQTDGVLRNGGVQAWIVGHRTVLGKITVNMESILQEWFESMDYIQITSLQRQCSFKRLPHHINSTVTRNDEIKTMMQEHILVIQKNRIEIEGEFL